MTQTEALAALRTAVAALSGISDVIVGWQDAPRPSTGHIWLWPIADVDQGLPHRISETQIRQCRALTVQVQGVGIVGVAALHRALVLLFADHPSTRALSAAGVAVQAVGVARDVTGLLASGHEPRQLADVVIGYVVELGATPALEATAIVVGLETQGADERTVTEILRVVP